MNLNNSDDASERPFDLIVMPQELYMNAIYHWIILISIIVGFATAFAWYYDIRNCLVCFGA